MRAAFMRTVVFAPGALVLASCATFGRGAPPATASLYARLGGYESLAAVTDDILAREVRDPVITPFFKGLDAGDLRRIRQHLLDQLCTATGGPCFYPGRDMKAVHAELEITEAAWNAFTRHIEETLTAFKVPEREHNELVVVIAGLKKDIVNKP